MKQNCQLKTNETLIQAHNVYYNNLFSLEAKPVLVHKWDFNATVKLSEPISKNNIKQMDTPNVISYGETGKLRRSSSSLEELKTQFNKTMTNLKYNVMWKNNDCRGIYMDIVFLCHYVSRIVCNFS